MTPDEVLDSYPPGDDPGWRVVDETLILIGLILVGDFLHQSRYPTDVMIALSDRVKLMIKQRGVETR